MKQLFIFVALSLSVLAQTPDHRNITQLGSWDASGAKITKPNRTGAALPGTCTAPETFQLTTTGAIYNCVSGAWVSTAATAAALAANGLNCSAGQSSLGVGANGAAEGCYDPNTYRSGQINFVYGGSATALVDAVTVNNVWRSHAHQATITEVTCWTDAGTVTLSVKDSAGNQITQSTLSCSSSGAWTPTMNASYALIGTGEGLGFTTSEVSGVKNLSVSIKYTRSY